MGAWIQYYFKVEPNDLEPEDFAQYWQRAVYLMQMMKPIKPSK
jgi:cephalosporin-C deacetylase-like acetyl esterase